MNNSSKNGASRKASSKGNTTAKKAFFPGKGAAPKKNVQAKPALPKVPAEWLYCCEKEVDAAMIAKACAQAGFSEVEYWQEACIAEIPIGEKASMDMEWIECDLEDETGNAFLADHQVKTLFMVTIVPAAYDRAKEAMLAIVAACGGFFCGDTEDFTPVIR